jgi:hypothetical protein
MVSRGHPPMPSGLSHVERGAIFTSPTAKQKALQSVTRFHTELGFSRPLAKRVRATFETRVGVLMANSFLRTILIAPVLGLTLTVAAASAQMAVVPGLAASGAQAGAAAGATAGVSAAGASGLATAAVIGGTVGAAAMTAVAVQMAILVA